jgi:hypothetical protein
MECGEGVSMEMKLELVIRMVTLGPSRNYLRAANLKSRSTFAFISNLSLNLKVIAVGKVIPEYSLYGRIYLAGI